MQVTLSIDDLVTEAQKLGGHRDKSDAVTEALRKYVQHHRQAKIVELFGTIEFEARYNHERQRRRA